jgi:DNA-binding winged helix-turn-helix (wHTH) protein/predicted ATPase
MAAEEPGTSGVLTLDLPGEQARLGEQRLRLTPKAFALLAHLVAHRNRLVTKTELLAAFWPATAVSDGVLTTTIREIRRALGEDSRGGGFIQTAHRRGYRFVGPVHVIEAPVGGAAEPLIVGRDAELERLEQRLHTAQAHTRQIVFVTGEAGIGKTALIDAFASRIAHRADLRLAHGQCVERYGVAEAYLPWLDALGELCRQPGSEWVIDTLRRVAPLWLSQLPALMRPEERAALHREVAGAPPERMLRELSEALEAIASERSLVLVLEDLHWADRSSVELLASVARRRQPARLLILCSYRPMEVKLAGNPLEGIKQDLQMHRQCVELTLDFLSPAAVDAYLTRRFPGLSGELGVLVHRRTEGNALFMVNTADYLAECRMIFEGVDRWELRGEVSAVEAAVPASLRAMIDRQLDRMSAEDRRLLEAASAVGAEFADAVLAPVLETTEEDVGRRCAALARRGSFIRAADEDTWPDGTATKRYAFIHALYADVLHEGLAPSSRVRIHRAIAERLETGWAGRVGEVAAKLAAHYERGHEPARAVEFLVQAAQNATQRLAYSEVIAELTRALELLETLPADAPTKKRELAIRMALAPAHMMTTGYAGPEVDGMYRRAEALCREVGDERQVFSVLVGRCGATLLAGRLDLAKSLAQRCVELARERQSPHYRIHAETALGITELWRGELASAAEHLEESRIADDVVTQRPPAFRLLHDPGAGGRAYAAWNRWMLGFPERAKRESAVAVDRGRDLSHPFTLAFVLAFSAFVHQARREVEATRERAEATIEICTEHGFAMYLAVASVFRGWALFETGRVREGLAVMEQAIADYAATGAVLVQPYFLGVMADAHLRCGQVERARELAERALAIVSRTGERMSEPELLRLLATSSAGADEAEACFDRALALARHQRALSVELRVATSRARWWRDHGREAEAHALLSGVLARFDEGFDTFDLIDAASLLEGSSRRT